MSLVSFSDVSFRYGGEGSKAAWIIRHLDLTIDTGEFYVLLGPSGCGKSTALSLLAGFEHASSGTVSVDGQPIAAPSSERAVVFQGDDSLYPWLTARENVEFPLKMAGVAAGERRDTAQQFLRLVGLANHQDKFPRQLSGGMKQRIQIARALVRRSPVLLMDEPFGALDAQTRSVLQDELVSIWQQTRPTILFITHDIAEAITLADRVGVMRAGPGSAIKQEVRIDLPRPRSRGSVEVAHLYEQLHEILSQEVKAVLRREEAA